MSDYTNTRVYANLIDGYNAGTANDEQARDRIISRGNQALYEDCKGYNAITSKRGYYDYPPGSKNSSNDELFNIYKNDVEFVNSFQEQVRDDEKRYFEQKYGPSVYKYLIDKRIGFNSDIQKITDKLRNPECNNIEKTSEIIKKNDEKNFKDFKDLYTKISQFYPSINSNTTFRKIEYRDQEHELLMTINSIINIIYYTLLFFMIILLASSGKLLIKERFLIYLLLIILPFLYPYVFIFIKKLFVRLFVSKESHGPKNAFVELPPPNIDAYDI